MSQTCDILAPQLYTIHKFVFCCLFFAQVSRVQRTKSADDANFLRVAVILDAFLQSFRPFLNLWGEEGTLLLEHIGASVFK